LPLKNDDLLLFHTCTSITIGNGAKTLFWKDAWINGSPLCTAFPEMFKLARRKHITVKDAMDKGRWMKGLQRISSPEQIDHFAELWHLITTVRLTEHEDVISWTKSSDHCYSAASAYNASFLHLTLKPMLAAIWDTRVEGKVRFFLWLLL
jgi:hypothetical protein